MVGWNPRPSGLKTSACCWPPAIPWDPQTAPSAEAGRTVGHSRRGGLTATDETGLDETEAERDAARAQVAAMREQAGHASAEAAVALSEQRSIADRATARAEG